MPKISTVAIARALTIGVTLLMGRAAGADAVTAGQELAAQAARAKERNDFLTAADLYRRALQQRPNHPGLTWQLARASARAGLRDDAMMALGDYASMGLNANVDIPDFAALATDPRIASIRDRFAANAKPIGSPAIFATLKEPQFLAEGIAFDPVKNRVFVSSVNKRKIVAVDSESRAVDFVRPAQDGLLGAFAPTRIMRLEFPSKRN